MTFEEIVQKEVVDSEFAELLLKSPEEAVEGLDCTISTTKVIMAMPEKHLRTLILHLQKGTMLSDRGGLQSLRGALTKGIRPDLPPRVRPTKE